MRNTMVPDSWCASRIQSEVDSAWAAREIHPDGTPNKWQGLSQSGVLINGFDLPKITAYPAFNQNKK